VKDMAKKVCFTKSEKRKFIDLIIDVIEDDIDLGQDPNGYQHKKIQKLNKLADKIKEC
jgi:hypothetical protein